MVMSKQELVEAIAEAYLDNSDSDGQWNCIEIASAVMSLLSGQHEGVLTQCESCGTWWPTKYYQCPYYDAHTCEGCENRNDECTCEDCSDCGVYYENCDYR